jgi:hypothetical protein
VSAFFSGYAVWVTQTINTYIYYLRKLPVLGKKIPESLYKRTGAKKGIGILAIIISALFKLSCVGLYCLCFVWLPAFGAQNILAGQGQAAPMEEMLLFLLLGLNMVIGSLINATTYHKTKSENLLMNLMHYDPSRCYKSAILLKIPKEAVCFGLAFLVMGLGVKTPFVLLGLICSRFIGEVIAMFTRNRLHNWWLILLLPIYGVVFFFPQWLFGFTLFWQVGVLAALVLLGAPCFVYLMRYKGYMSLARQTVHLSDLADMDARMANAMVSNIQIQDKSLRPEDLSPQKFKNKHGYAYLNALFFDRHKRLVQNALRIRFIIIGILTGALAAIALLVSPEMKETIWEGLLASPRYFLLLMYFVSVGANICKAFFYHCDVFLLRYGYYRQGEVILKNFAMRLKRLVFINLLPAVGIVLGLALICVCLGHGGDMPRLFSAMASVLLLSCFFSVFHMFMYYFFQPYTADQTVKSPLFSIINSAVYVVCFMCANSQELGPHLSVYALVATALFIPISLWLVYQKSPKRFRIR